MIQKLFSFAVVLTFTFFIFLPRTHAFEFSGLSFSSDQDVISYLNLIDFDHDEAGFYIKETKPQDKTKLKKDLSAESLIVSNVVVAEKVDEKKIKEIKEEVKTESKQESGQVNQDQPVASASTPANSIGGLNAELLFQMANDHRARIGKPAFIKHEKSCALAASRAPEVNAEVYGGYMHAGLKNRNLDYWNTENIIAMRTEAEAFNWWINDYIHRIAIEGDYTYSCVACHGNACAQEFTNFQPK